MSAGKYNLYIEQGATLSKTLIYQNANGDPIDLTGSTIESEMRASYSDTTVIKTFTINILDQMVPENVGKFILSLTAIETGEIPVFQAYDFENKVTNYTYDIKLTTGAVVKRILQGDCIISPQVTV